MDKINVMHIMRPAEGGMKDHVLNLVRRHNSERYNIIIGCPPSAGMQEAFHDLGVQTYSLELSGEISPQRDLRLIQSLTRVFIEHQIQIVHTHGIKAGLVGRWAAARAGVPAVVATVHNFLYGEKVPPWRRAAYTAAQRWLARGTDHFITVSQALAGEITRKEGAPPERVSTIYNGIDLGRFQMIIDYARKKQELGLQVKAPVVGTVARLIPQKGVDCFLRAALIVKFFMPDVQFLIVGDGPQRQELEEEARSMNLAHDVVFTGFRSDVPQILPLLNVFVAPSLSEGLSIATLEAMAARRPVVASAVGGLKEIVIPGRTGLLVEPNDPEALADAVLGLLKSPRKAQAYGTSAREMVEQKFQVQTMVKQTENIYERLIHEKGLKAVEETVHAVKEGLIT
ncbi:MAG: GT4 family glycosyltransferase PelF [Bacillota bacterium]